MKAPDIKAKLREVPHQPGVYLMKDRLGSIIYVGKALSLADRIRSYFQSPAGQTPKTRRLVEKPKSMDNNLALVGCYYFRSGEALVAAIQETAL